jgi:HlyD family secretion protein
MQLIRRSSSKEISTSRADGREDSASVPALLEFQSPTAAVIALPLPPLARGTIWVITSMWAAFAMIIAFCPIDVVVTGIGKVISPDQPIVLSPVETSVVRKIYVSDNQVVRAGDLLAQLDPTFPAADKASLESDVRSLTAETSRLQAEIEKRPFVYAGLDPAMALQAALYAQRQAQFKYTVSNYDQQIAGLQALVERSQADADGYRQRLGSAKDIEGVRKELERLQVGSRLNSLQAQDYRAEMQRSLDNALQTIANARGNLDAMRAQRDAFIQQWYADAAQKLSDDARLLAENKESLRKAELRTKMVELRAEQDATVLNVAKISSGTVLNPGDEFITLVPLTRPEKLEVEVYLPGNEQGWLEVGQNAVIKFDTFKYIRYGTAVGTVRYISPDSYPSNGGGTGPAVGTGMVPTSAPTPIQTAVAQLSPPIVSPSTYPVFLVRLSIDQLNLRHLPAEFQLVPGMPVQADIAVGNRTILDYLLDRILPLGVEAMREP